MSAAQATEIKNMVFIKFTVDQTKNRNTFCLIEKTLNVPAGQARPAGLNWLNSDFRVAPHSMQRCRLTPGQN